MREVAAFLTDRSGCRRKPKAGEHERDEKQSAHRKGDRLIESVVSEVFVFIKQPFCSPRLVNCATAGLNEEKKLSGEAPSPGFTPWFLYVLPKISPTCQQQNHRQARDAGCGVPGRNNTPSLLPLWNQSWWNHDRSFYGECQIFEWCLTFRHSHR